MPKGVYDHWKLKGKHKEECSCTRCIKIPWNKGKNYEEGYGRERAEEIRKKLKKNNWMNSKDYKKEMHPMFGRKNKNIYNKGKTYEEVFGEKKAKEIKENLSKSHMGIVYSVEALRKKLKRNPKSSLEIKFEQIINKFNLPYKFVGNGEFLIGRKCPDFININGEKIAIEVYYKGHKEKFRGGLSNWIEERERLFNLFGWKIEFFDEIQVNEEEVVRRIG